MPNFELAQQMEEAFNQIGTSMMKGDFACKLLAYTYCLGSEATVLHKGMNAGIAIASQKLNIKGGERMKAEYLAPLQARINEIENGLLSVKNQKGDTLENLTKAVPWLQEIWDRYEIPKLMTKPFSFVAQK